ncbi:MAG TPA: carbohydrate ABC transporter permease [Candidatus Mediterraneibacter cottocaccae]|nr:carbohydrate ABC transporter permease [Candidatus Mediterraneibacter cottocaccae]
MQKKTKLFPVFLHLFFILLSACFVIPLVVVISASFTSEEWLTAGNGLSILPHGFTTAAYASAFRNGARLIRAYAVTIIQSGLGTLLSCIVAGMAAYALSRRQFRFRMPITVIIFFTMLFSAGMIPTYIIYAKYYGLSDNFLIYILPGMTGGAYYTMVFRTFFKSLPESLFESAHLDGASELRIFARIIVPLSKPVFASVGFMTLVAKWNDYTTSMIYIRDENLYTLQYLLQRMMEEAEFLKNLSRGMMGSITMSAADIPSETLRYAMCVIAAGPMLLIFPFFQKYFSTGLTIGAVKE